MLFKALLIAALAAAAGPAKPETFRRLLLDVERTGEASTIQGALAGYLGVEDPTPCKVRNWPASKDGVLRSVYVCPQHVFYLTRRGPPNRELKRFLRLSRAGKLEQIILWTETLDEEGRSRVDQPSIRGENVGTKKAKNWLKQENDFYLGRRDP